MHHKFGTTALIDQRIVGKEGVVLRNIKVIHCSWCGQTLVAQHLCNDTAQQGQAVTRLNAVRGHPIITRNPEQMFIGSPDAPQLAARTVTRS